MRASGSRPGRPLALQGAALSGPGFNEGKGRPYTAEDIRFTTRDGKLYALALGWPTVGRLVVRSLAEGSPDRGEIRSVRLLGSPGELEWRRAGEGLAVQLPATPPCDHAYALEIRGLELR